MNEVTPIGMLEKKLLEREVNSIKHEVERALQIIAAALEPYKNTDRGINVPDQGPCSKELSEFLWRCYRQATTPVIT